MSAGRDRSPRRLRVPATGRLTPTVLVLCGNTDFFGRSVAIRLGSVVEWTVRPIHDRPLQRLLPGGAPTVRWRLDLYPLAGSEPIGVLTGRVEWIEELSYEGRLRREPEGWRIEPIPGSGRLTVASRAPSSGSPLRVRDGVALGEGWHGVLAASRQCQQVFSNDQTLISITNAVIVPGPVPGRMR